MQKYIDDGIKINTIGELSKLPKDLQEAIGDWKEKTQYNKKLILTLALNYGGRDEIIRAIKRLAQDNKQFNNLTMEQFEQYLDTAGLPDPDLIIRTGKRKRLSGFLPWQSEYTEFYFTDILFPDFTMKEFEKALKDFTSRDRRFGR